MPSGDERSNWVAHRRKRDITVNQKYPRLNQQAMPTVTTSQIRQGSSTTFSFSSTISERRPNQYCEFKCMASRISKSMFCCFNSSRIGQHVIVALGDEYNWLLYFVQEFIFWKLTKFFLHYDCQSHRLFWFRRDLRCISQCPPAFVNIRYTNPFCIL